jgi:divalent metal cation (Fe/Co/Zn/Cd) transporter
MAPLGIVVFATLMGMSAVLVLVESVKFLSDGLTKNAPTASEPADKVAGTVAILGFVVVVKILLLVGCRHVQNLRGSATVEAYTDDHRNDILSNSLSIGAFCLSQLQCGQPRSSDGVCPSVDLWWVDPATAILLSLFIIYSWTCSARDQLLLLVGHRAPTDLMTQLTYAAASHEPDTVVLVDKVLAWSVGEHYHAEVDLCMPPMMALKEAHDVGGTGS